MYTYIFTKSHAHFEFGIHRRITSLLNTLTLVKSSVDSYDSRLRGAQSPLRTLKNDILVYTVQTWPHFDILSRMTSYFNFLRKTEM